MGREQILWLFSIDFFSSKELRAFVYYFVNGFLDSSNSNFVYFYNFFALAKNMEYLHVCQVLILLFSNEMRQSVRPGWYRWSIAFNTYLCYMKYINCCVYLCFMKYLIITLLFIMSNNVFTFVCEVIYILYFLMPIKIIYMF